MIWIGILAGFVPRIAAQFVEHKPPYLAIVRVHAAVFVGWLLLLTVQVGGQDTKRTLKHADMAPFLRSPRVGRDAHAGWRSARDQTQRPSKDGVI
jgi:hypothetical protein